MQDIDALRRSVDLARLIADHGVELKPAGPGKQSGLCPFHRERTPSFGVFRGEDGAQRFHCFGCNASGDVLDWLKLTQGLDTVRAIAYLGGGNGAAPHPAPPPPTPVERKPWADPAGRRITAVWDYTNAAGALLYQQVRIEPGKNGRSKDFQTRSPNPVGGYWFGMADAERVLWNLPAVLAASEVWIVEGEKDARALMLAGIPCATTNSHGADGWRQSLAAPLAGKTVYVCGDTDTPGLARDARILRDVTPIAASTYLVRLPEGCKDASEWLEAGQSVEALRKLAKLIERPAEPEPSTADVDAALAGIPPGDPPPPAGPDDSPDLRWLNQTDSGNGERLIAMFGPLVAYTAEMKSWMAFDAIQWQIDDLERASNYARVTMREFYRQAETSQMDSDTQKQALKWARRSESANGIASMMRMARTLPGVTISAGQLDRNPMLLNLQNGTFDLERFELREHRREDFITKLAPVAYLPDAQCPNWIRFLDRIFDGREDVIRYLQRALGYTLTGSVQEKAMFCLFGESGDNGKTTLLEVVRYVLGDYSGQIDIETITSRPGTESNATLADLADLRGARFVTTSESSEGATLNEARIKYLTGMGEMRACRKYENHIVWMPTHKLWMESNHRPVIRGGDKAVWARLKPIGFTVSIPKDEQDQALRGKLQTEAAGILRWMLDGYRDWRQQGLGRCPDMDEDLERWKKESDPLEEFVEERCEARPEAWVAVVTMRKAYDSWAEENGNKFTLSPSKFNRLMEARGFRRTLKRTGMDVLKVWEGVSVRSSTWNL